MTEVGHEDDGLVLRRNGGRSLGKHEARQRKYPCKGEDGQPGNSNSHDKKFLSIFHSISSAPESVDAARSAPAA
jgi:hypothetical protein